MKRDLAAHRESHFCSRGRWHDGSQLQDVTTTPRHCDDDFVQGKTMIAVPACVPLNTITATR